MTTLQVTIMMCEFVLHRQMRKMIFKLRRADTCSLLEVC
jgi:hypothetical protein